jgi:uncharacterized metal-binding protein
MITSDSILDYISSILLYIGSSILLASALILIPITNVSDREYMFNHVSIYMIVIALQLMLLAFLIAGYLLQKENRKLSDEIASLHVVT